MQNPLTLASWWRLDSWQGSGSICPRKVNLTVPSVVLGQDGLNPCDSESLSACSVSAAV